MPSAFELLRRAWAPGAPCLFLDGGSDAGPQDTRGWSYLAREPAAAMCAREDEVWWREGAGAWTRIDASPWDALRRLRAPGPAVPGVPFPYGVAGFVSYDAGRLIERVPTRAEDDTALPWLLFFRFDEVWAQPRGAAARRFARERGSEGARAEGWARSGGKGDDDGAALPSDPSPFPPPSAPRPPPSTVRIGPIEARTSPKEFEAMVVRAKEHIRAGDVFQVNLSHRLACDVEGSPLELYARLREVNPAPFSAFLSSGPLPWDKEGFHLLSASPERLFSLRGRRLEARPIAGTRRRDADPARDAALVEELRADPKERAEHVMLVDLARNDLGRVARFGSVRVRDLLTVETYRTVHHLVSVVEGELAEGKDAVDALAALFPGGTITGAPKVRAMEIIEELEPVRRGAYTGSLGWIGPDGDADLNILIRTIVLARGRAERVSVGPDVPAGAWRAHLQVGAGIVEESEPRREYEETLAKAKGLLLALGREAP